MPIAMASMVPGMARRRRACIISKLLGLGVALRELMAKTENGARTMAEGQTAFEGAASGVGTWMGGPDDKPIIARMALHESPVVALSRRKSRDGNPFLSRTMVRAA